MGAASRANRFNSFALRRAVAGVRRRLSDLFRRTPLLLLAIAAASGVLLDHLVEQSVAVWIATSALPLIGCLCVTRGRVWWMLAISLVPLFAARSASDLARYEASTLRSYLNEISEPSIIEGIVTGIPIRRSHSLSGYPDRRDLPEYQTEFEFHVDRLKVGTSWEPVEGKILVVLHGVNDSIEPGSRFRLFGHVNAPRGPTNPGEKDQRESYRHQRLQGRMSVTEESGIELLEEATSGSLVSRFQRGISRFANHSRDALLVHTAESTGGLAIALVIGQRDYVDSETRDKLLVTGTAHMLSVSGLHLAIVVVIVRWLAILLRFPPSLQLTSVVAVTIFYASMTGGRPPVIRASLLVAVFLLAVIFRRPGNTLNALSLAALILLVTNPTNLFGVGVQLSFLAVATLLVCGRTTAEGTSSVERIVEEERLRALIESSASSPSRAFRWVWQWLRQAAWYSGCVTVISGPWVWYHFHVVAPISFLANVVIGPLIGISLMSGLATAALALLGESLAVIPGWICDWSLGTIVGFIDGFARVPLGHFWLPSPPLGWVLGFYAFIVLSMLAPATRTFRLFRYFAITCWFLAVLWISLQPAPMNDTEMSGTSLEATFIDVGHGTSVVLRLAPHEVWLYDGGRLGNPLGSAADIDHVLWSLNVRHLRGVIVSHGDADHYNALSAILKRFSVEGLYVPPRLFERDPLLAQLHEVARSRRIRIHNWTSGAEIRSDGYVMRVLHPPGQRIEGSDNANSIVLVVEPGKTSLVLPGDLEPPGTELLLQQPRPPAGGVLMAPHHGSLQLDHRTILDWSRPAAVVVSGGFRAARPEVAESLSATGAGTWNTAEQGAIRVRMDPKGLLQIRSWLQSPW